MKKRLFIGTLLLLVIISAFLYAEDGWRENEMEILVFMQNRTEVQQLWTLNLMGDVYPAAAYSSSLDAEAVGRMYVTPDELQKIKDIPIAYQIEIENLNEHYKDFWNERQGYSSVDEIFQRMDDLVSQNPEICLKKVYGKSVRGEDLTALKISDNVKTDEPEPEVLFDMGVHGNEFGGPENGIMYAEEIVSQYGKDARTTAMIDEREIWIFVMVNPDGRNNNSRANANNKDLNRNWGYMATNGFSEPETRAVRDCHLDNHFTLDITYHSGMIALLYPWCRVPAAIPDKQLHLDMAAVYEGAADYGSMRIVQSYNDFQTTGETIEWTYGASGTLTLTMEISVEKNTPNEIMSYYNKNVEAMNTIIEYAGYGVGGTVTNAKTRENVAAVIFVNDYFPCYSDFTGGDYYKWLSSGSYSIDVFANGFKPASATNVAVQDQAATVQDFALEPDNIGRSTWAYKVLFTEVGTGETPAALGPNDDNSFTLNSGSAITFDMQYEIKNINGNEFRVHATGSGANYTFSASENVDGPWKELGSGSGAQDFDLDEGSLNNARYVQIEGRCEIDAIEGYWDSPTSILKANNSIQKPVQLFIANTGRNVSFNVMSDQNHSLSIFSVQGRLCWQKNSKLKDEIHSWQPSGAGTYIARVQAGNNIVCKRFSVIK